MTTLLDELNTLEMTPDYRQSIDDRRADTTQSVARNRAAQTLPVTWAVHHGDCITGMAEHLAPNSVDLCVSSIPFSDLFVYSGKLEDAGNNDDGSDSRQSMFGLNLRFFIAQLYRVMKPGRNACIHIQQLVAYGNKHGYIGRRDFRGAVIDMFIAGGFDHYGEFDIPKNPQIVAKRSNLHSLMFATGKRDSTQLAPACNDYVVILRKPGDNAVPVRALYDKIDNPGGWVSTEEWIRDAHGVWTDIRETDVLPEVKGARDEGDEKHVCPLQLEVIRRCIRLYSNPGEIVLDPFMGVGSTAVVALEQGRSTVGFELKDSYHRQAVKALEKRSGNGVTKQTDMVAMFGEDEILPATETDAWEIAEWGDLEDSPLTHDPDAIALTEQEREWIRRMAGQKKRGKVEQTPQEFLRATLRQLAEKAGVVAEEEDTEEVAA